MTSEKEIDVSDIDRFKLVNHQLPNPNQHEGCIVVRETMKDAFVAVDGEWVKHVGMSELVRELVR